MKKNQEKFEKVLKITEMANDYIRLYTVYEYAMSYKEQDEDYVLPKEAEIFLNIQKELNITSETKGIKLKLNSEVNDEVEITFEKQSDNSAKVSNLDFSKMQLK